MRILLAFACLGLSCIAAWAEPVAVFNVQWGKGRGKQVRSFAIAFDEKAAPYTVWNFKRLINKGFYRKTTIHRVIPDYLIQGGDPLSKGNDKTIVGTGGPGYTLPAEIHLKHTIGAVAMGRLADAVNPNRLSNGSQFYICIAPIPSQDGKDTVFGKVVGGFDAIREISHLPADSNANPLTPVVVTRTYMIDSSQLGGPPARKR
jgi:cyclophilin family peptidyl-prolyl cis-trans isomerase